MSRIPIGLPIDTSIRIKYRHSEGKDSTFPATSVQTHYMTRCNNPEDHHLTVLKLYDSSTECSFAKQRRPDFLAPAFTQTQTQTQTQSQSQSTTFV
jgi:hypothetical protein